MDVVQYTPVTQATPVTLKNAPAFLVGYTVVSSASGTVTVYDNTAASGNVLLTKTSLAAGDVVTFGGLGIQARVGLHVVVGGTANVNMLFA